jgi:hypothetical protein
MKIARFRLGYPVAVGVTELLALVLLGAPIGCQKHAANPSTPAASTAPASGTQTASTAQANSTQAASAAPVTNSAPLAGELVPVAIARTDSAPSSSEPSRFHGASFRSQAGDAPGLPNLVGALSEAKSLCEAQATAAKQVTRPRIGRLIRLEEGEKLYEHARTTADRCIDFLETALLRDVNATDTQQINDLLTETRAKTAKFVEWATDIQDPRARPTVASPFDEAGQLVDDWLRALGEQGTQSKEALRQSLEQCRLPRWKDL